MAEFGRCRGDAAGAHASTTGPTIAATAYVGLEATNTATEIASAVELPADAATLNAATPAADGRDLARLWWSSFGGLPSAAMLAKAGTVLAVVIFAGFLLFKYLCVSVEEESGGSGDWDRG